MDDPDLSAHRVRSNRRPEPKLHPPAALVIAVEDIFAGQPIEDRN